MKIISLGDIHGRPYWKKINPKDWDKIIFIGDYVDSFNVPTEKILSNLRDIVQFKKKYKDKVILLYGNHDLSYAFWPDYLCSGFKPEMSFLYRDIFDRNREFFQAAYQYKNYLWTHAGVSNKWLETYKLLFKNHFDLKDDLSNIAEVFNKVNKSSSQFVLHELGAKRGGLRHSKGGITWADKTETLEGIPPGLHQIVGHTYLKEITTYNKIMGTTFEDRSITYIDVLAYFKDDKIDQAFYKLEIA